MPIQQDDITRFYADIATAIERKDLDALASVVTPGFTATALAGDTVQRDDWLRTLRDEFDRVIYKDVHFTLARLVTSGDQAVASVLKRFIGTNDQGDHFDSEVTSREVLDASSGEVKLTSTEIQRRRLQLGAQPFTTLSLIESRGIDKMCQACGD
jgi:ketosteroid isomerase-like protein